MGNVFKNKWPWLLALVSVNVMSQPISIDSGWIRLLPPSIENTAAYLQITNLTDESQEILGIEASISSKAEVHRSYIENGLMRMEPVKAFSIAPGATFSMPADGTHIMLIGLRSPLEVGQFHKLCLSLDNGSRVCREVEVLNNLTSGSYDRHNH